MRKIIKNSILLFIPILFLSCVDEEKAPTVEAHLSVSNLTSSSEINVSIDGEYHTVKHHGEYYFGSFVHTKFFRGKGKYDVFYNDVEPVELDKKENHVYYATECNEEGYFVHQIDKQVVNVINLSDLDISTDSNALRLQSRDDYYEYNDGDENATHVFNIKEDDVVQEDIPACSMVTVSLDTDLFTEDFFLLIDGISEERHYTYIYHPDLISINIIIFKDYTFEVSQLYSYSAEQKLSDDKFREEENFDSDSDWDWD